ncbi:hypothetical protein ABIB30_002233 [Pedobacter sp. UYP1]
MIASLPIKNNIYTDENAILLKTSFFIFLNDLLPGYVLSAVRTSCLIAMLHPMEKFEHIYTIILKTK